LAVPHTVLEAASVAEVKVQDSESAVVVASRKAGHWGMMADLDHYTLNRLLLHTYIRAGARLYIILVLSIAMSVAHDKRYLPERDFLALAEIGQDYDMG
jgi:hypothetical protein